MKLETLKKGIDLNDKIIRERQILDKINKLNTINNSKNLTSADIKYLISRAYEGSDYIVRDLKQKLEDLAE